MSAALPAPAERKVYTVSELNRAARTLLETNFPLLWLAGEVSNLSRPASGHLYFSLKDSAAQVRCALFRNRSRLLRVALSNGQQVTVRARISLYEPRGDYQLIVEHLEGGGEGALRRAFETLKNRLHSEGLFAADRKQKLPRFPRRLGVITSPGAAALRDVLSVLKRRFPALPVLLYPVLVQGDGAAEQIAAAVRLADQRRDCDVLLLTRGGGSLEDLQAFNDERVARAIAACRLPLVAGVGHETDVTIADFVADLRAPTPSAAAELVSPDAADLLTRIGRARSRLTAALQRRLRERQQTVDRLGLRLRRRHPGQHIARRRERLIDLNRRLRQTGRAGLERRRQRLTAVGLRLKARAPLDRLQRLTERRRTLTAALARALSGRLQGRRQRLAAAARALQDLSPLRTLARGYAVVRDADGSVLRDAGQTAPGRALRVQLQRGRLLCRVETAETDGD